MGWRRNTLLWLGGRLWRHGQVELRVRSAPLRDRAVGRRNMFGHRRSRADVRGRMNAGTGCRPGDQSEVLAATGGRGLLRCAGPGGGHASPGGSLRVVARWLTVARLTFAAARCGLIPTHGSGGLGGPWVGFWSVGPTEPRRLKTGIDNAGRAGVFDTSSVGSCRWKMMPGSSVAEQVTVNHLVAGSIPARAAISPEWPGMTADTNLWANARLPAAALL